MHFRQRHPHFTHVIDGQPAEKSQVCLLRDYAWGQADEFSCESAPNIFSAASGQRRIDSAPYAGRVKGQNSRSNPHQPSYEVF